MGGTHLRKKFRKDAKTKRRTEMTSRKIEQKRGAEKTNTMLPVLRSEMQRCQVKPLDGPATYSSRGRRQGSSPRLYGGGGGCTHSSMIVLIQRPATCFESASMDLGEGGTLDRSFSQSRPSPHPAATPPSPC